MAKDLILVGGGGHCRSVIETAESSGLTIRGILDLPQFIGSEVSGYPVLGCDDDIPSYVNDCDFVITLGAIESEGPRQRLHNLVKEAGGNLAPVIASTAFVSPRAWLGAGTVVLHQAVVNAGARVGESVIVNTGAIVEHDAVVGDLTHVSTGAKVNGGCRVGSRCFIGSGAVLVQGVSLVDDVFIGAGSLMARNARESGRYIGFPARKM